MNSIKPIHLLWLIIIPIAFIKCGQRGTLTGGPKDSIPPILINASPKMNTVHFDRDEIRLTFDEFITLKD
ncbi:MAG: Ig-like domain-containing protein, partial [Flavobacteriaceae bacterium]|nr:Ig-like domain-containing protein [Flavobacteriaceae bacterium]